MCLRGRGRRVGEVCDEEARERPVVPAVFEDVERGHGSEGEAVHDECFELALHEMDEHHDQTQGLEIGWWWHSGEGVGRQGVYLRAEKVDEWVDEDGAEVFDDEDGAPGDLRSEVFDCDHAAVAEAGRLEGGLFGRGNERAIAAFGDA